MVWKKRQVNQVNMIKKPKCNTELKSALEAEKKSAFKNTYIS